MVKEVVEVNENELGGVVKRKTKRQKSEVDARRWRLVFGGEVEVKWVSGFD